MGDKPWEVMTAEEYDIYRNNKYKNENNQDADGKFHAENEALRKKYGIEDDSYSYDDLRYQSAYGINPYDNAARQNYRNIGKIRRRENPYKNELYNVADSLKNFKYDPESDNAFSAYKDAAIREGTAQRNKIYSDLTSMTGGRNNSWATAAVAQSGNATAQKIADIIPELSEKAYNKLLKMYDVRLNQYEVEEQERQRDIDIELEKYDNNVKAADAYRKTSQTEINNELKNIRTTQEIEKAGIELQYLTHQEYIKLIMGELDIEQAKANIEYRKAQTAKIYGNL